MRNYLKNNPDLIQTPAYYFDLDEFARRTQMVCSKLKWIPLTYSIKANPFLVCGLPDQIRHVEVCSPGELDICRMQHIPGERIIYSGVNKENWDIEEALSWGVDIVTAESKYHVFLEQEAAHKAGIKQKTILRLSSGNQFGMSEEDILSILQETERYPNLDFYGIHYYSGTQKKTKQIQRDLEKIEAFLEIAEKKTGFRPGLVEMGPGLQINYFDPPYEQAEMQALEEAAPLLMDFAKRYPLGIEMGRYLAASCGTFSTRVKDLKNNQETNYVICDGGIHQLNYYGQNMAMRIPETEAISESRSKQNYCICGSLCTTADILVRDIELPELKQGDVLLFHRCGAYSVTEGISLFLSRDLPAVYAYSRKGGMVKLREKRRIWALNTKGRAEQE